MAEVARSLPAEDRDGPDDAGITEGKDCGRFGRHRDLGENPSSKCSGEVLGTQWVLCPRSPNGVAFGGSEREPASSAKPEAGSLLS